MVAFRGHFDGKVLVPDEPLDLPRGQRLVIRVETDQERPPGVPGRELLDLAGTLSDEDARQMLEAIEEGCEQVDPNEW